MNLWPVILLSGLLTYAIRLSFIALFGRMQVPPWMQRALRFVPPAVLTAILLPDLVMHGGSLDLSLGNERLMAGLLATFVAWRTRNMLLTILAGMAALILFLAIQ